MAEITKFGASEVSFHIRHDFREIPAGKEYGNEAIDPERSRGNYSLLEGRCQTASEANKYRKELEKEIFKYNRKNLVHAVEIAVQCPSDCPPEQKEDFFRETYKYICSTLPMGEQCVFVAQVHTDERHYSPSGEMISKDHLHLMYVPAVPDNKHDGYEYRLCADQLTKRARLKEFHPGLQKHLNDAGIKATVYSKKEGDGKTIGLSVKELKKITEKTGVVIDHSLTVEELEAILSKNVDLNHKVDVLTTTLSEQKHDITELTKIVSDKDRQIGSLQSEIRASKAAGITTDKEKAELQQKLQEKEQEIRQTAGANQKLQEYIKTLQEALKTKDIELQQERQKVTELETSKSTVSATPKEHTWGEDSGWGSTSGWGRDALNKPKEHMEEISL